MQREKKRATTVAVMIQCNFFFTIVRQSVVDTHYYACPSNEHVLLCSSNEHVLCPSNGHSIGGGGRFIARAISDWDPIITSQHIDHGRPLYFSCTLEEHSLSIISFVGLKKNPISLSLPPSHTHKIHTNKHAYYTHTYIYTSRTHARTRCCFSSRPMSPPEKISTGKKSRAYRMIQCFGFCCCTNSSK